MPQVVLYASRFERLMGDAAVLQPADKFRVFASPAGEILIVSIYPDDVLVQLPCCDPKSQNGEKPFRRIRSVIFGPK